MRGNSSPGTRGARGPIKPSEFFVYNPGSVAFPASPSVVEDSSDSFWSGVQQCGAIIALTASMALTAWMTDVGAQQYFQDEIVPPAVAACPNEDYWIKPMPAPAVWAAPAIPLDEVIASLVVVNAPPEEVYWINSVAPVVAGPYARPFLEQDHFPLLYGVPNEDYWLFTSMAPPIVISGPNKIVQQWAMEMNEKIPAPIAGTTKLVIWIADDYG